MGVGPSGTALVRQRRFRRVGDPGGPGPDRLACRQMLPIYLGAGDLRREPLADLITQLHPHLEAETHDAFHGGHNAGGRA